MIDMGVAITTMSPTRAGIYRAPCAHKVHK